MTEGKVPVTLRSIIQRLNRLLAKDARILKKSRPGAGGMIRNFGRYYIVNLRTQRVGDTHVNPVALAHQLGVIAAWEELVQESD